MRKEIGRSTLKKWFTQKVLLLGRLERSPPCLAEAPRLVIGEDDLHW